MRGGIRTASQSSVRFSSGASRLVRTRLASRNWGAATAWLVASMAILLAGRRPGGFMGECVRRRLKGSAQGKRQKKAKEGKRQKAKTVLFLPSAFCLLPFVERRFLPSAFCLVPFGERRPRRRRLDDRGRKGHRHRRGHEDHRDRGVDGEDERGAAEQRAGKCRGGEAP